jgi:hypothetical protein
MVDSSQFSTKDIILYLLATAATVAVFLMPRTPISVIVGSIILFALLVHPTLYLPYVVGKSSTNRRRRKIFALLATALVIGTAGFFAWREAIGEIEEDISRNLTGEVSLYPDNLLASRFSFVNESGHDILSTDISCMANEIYMQDGHYMIGDNFDDRSSIVIKSGKDSRSEECFRIVLRAMTEFATSRVLCGDITIGMNYRMVEFPHFDGRKERRFLIRTTHDGFTWSPEAISAPTGYCSGRPLSAH